jgi:hypothetical protein
MGGGLGPEASGRKLRYRDDTLGVMVGIVTR